MSSVLALSFAGDLHADVVVSALENRSVKVCRVNTDVVESFHLAYRSSDSLFRLVQGAREVVLDEEWSIWNRRLTIPEASASVPPHVAEIVAGETTKTFEALLEGHRGLVVSRPGALNRGGNKISQLNFVRRAPEDVRIPDTIVTNVPDEVRRFYERHDGNVCFKLHKGVSVERDGQQHLVYTNKVEVSHLQHLELVRQNPSLFQEYIEKQYDLRITVVGERLFGVAIHSQDSPVSKVDFRRYDFERVRYEAVGLPPDVKSICLRMLAHYGLRFGAFDFVVTPNGEYVFLELNPNGQWLWLEEITGAPISEAIADLLAAM